MAWSISSSPSRFSTTVRVGSAGHQGLLSDTAAFQRTWRRVVIVVGVRADGMTRSRGRHGTGLSWGGLLLACDGSRTGGRHRRLCHSLPHGKPRLPRALWRGRLPETIGQTLFPKRYRQRLPVWLARRREGVSEGVVVLPKPAIELGSAASRGPFVGCFLTDPCRLVSSSRDHFNTPIHHVDELREQTVKLS